MSDSSTIEVNGGQLQDFTIDQFAGALALTLGSVGGLLMIICKMNCCYLFQCERRPPQDNEKDSDDEPLNEPAPEVAQEERIIPPIAEADEQVNNP